MDIPVLFLTHRCWRTPFSNATRFLVALILLAWAHTALATANDHESFGNIIVEHCLRCHKAGNAKGEVILSEPTKFAEAGWIDLKQPTQSLLLEVIQSHNGKPPRMPAEGKPLSDAQVAIIQKWIESGAAWPEGQTLKEKSKADSTWWAYQPIRTRDALQSDLFEKSSKVSASESLPNSLPNSFVDSWIDVELSQQGLRAAQPASRRTWLRRATLTLTGLLPTPEALRDFEQDTRPDATHRVIDRLLASPAYGEQMGRHWLDVVRFGESNGFERNFIIDNMWPYRDYVIRSWNEDKPFDQMIREHLAGDVIGPGLEDKELGVAFLVCGPYDDVGNQDPVQAANIRANTIDDIIRATSEAFLGLTVGCARCHDHKFDPITQSDYYSLYATFAGVRHGARPFTTPEQQQDRTAKLKPLEAKLNELRESERKIDADVLSRAEKRRTEIEAAWIRPAVSRYETVDTFDSIEARFVRLKVLNRQDNPSANSGFRIDEFEVWSAEPGNRDDGSSQTTPFQSQNVALRSNGGKATGGSRSPTDFAEAYSADLAIDGKFGERWIASSPELVIELAETTWIHRVVFSSDRPKALPPDSGITPFVGDYTIEVSIDGQSWTKVASSTDRQPPTEAHRKQRWTALEITAEEKQKLQSLRKEIAESTKAIAAIPTPPTYWLGTRETAAGPFKIFLGGDTQRPGDEVKISSLSAVQNSGCKYELPSTASEQDRRTALADWLARSDNPLPARVLANRLWQWCFGTGIVDTSSDLGYLGARPTHPELLDALARELLDDAWSTKRVMRSILLSNTFQRSSEWNETSAATDADARLLWRYPPRRMSAEEVRDAMLTAASGLDLRRGGPGFRLYHVMQDNVSTYTPLDTHGPETWRRSVYHQNVRAQFVDVMSDFDCPDPAGAVPRRAATTTPLQALTLLNHSFTLSLADVWVKRLADESNDIDLQIRVAIESAYGRGASEEELRLSRDFVQQHGMTAWCRALLNSSELIYIE